MYFQNFLQQKLKKIDFLTFCKNATEFQLFRNWTRAFYPKFEIFDGMLKGHLESVNAVAIKIKIEKTILGTW